MKFRDLQSLLVCFIILWRSSFLRVEWISVLAGISDPNLCLELDVHSLHAMMCLPTREKSKDCIHLDKVMKKTPVDLQKCFPIYHACPKNLAAHRCGSAFPENGSAFRQDLDEVGKTLIDW